MRNGRARGRGLDKASSRRPPAQRYGRAAHHGPVSGGGPAAPLPHEAGRVQGRITRLDFGEDVAHQNADPATVTLLPLNELVGEQIGLELLGAQQRLGEKDALSEVVVPRPVAFRGIDLGQSIAPVTTNAVPRLSLRRDPERIAGPDPEQDSPLLLLQKGRVCARGRFVD